MEENKKQQRKEYAKRGERGQKMIAFRCDLKLLPWLKSKPNMGRYINELISKDARKAVKGEFDDEHTDELERLGDYEDIHEQ